jgi:hypothetical protein
VPRIPTAFREPYPTAATELQPSAAPPCYRTHIVQLPYGTSQRRPSPFCMAANTRDSYSSFSWLSSVPPICRNGAPNWATASLHTLSTPLDVAQCGLINSFAKSGEHVTKGCQVPRCSHREKVCRCRRFGRTCYLCHQGCSVQTYTLYRPTHHSMHRHNTTPYWPLNCD